MCHCPISPCLSLFLNPCWNYAACSKVCSWRALVCALSVSLRDSPTTRARDLPSQRKCLGPMSLPFPTIIRDAKVATIAKIMKIGMQTLLFVLFIHLRRQPHSVRCRPRDSEPQRVRFPVFVADGRSLALEKGPIQDLSKYQTSPKEKFNHRAAYLVISEAKSSPPFAEVRFCVFLSPCLSPFSFFFCSIENRTR